eukprot:3544264-Pleurochrysis_carterae.AAC.1
MHATHGNLGMLFQHAAATACILSLALADHQMPPPNFDQDLQNAPTFSKAEHAKPSDVAALLCERAGSGVECTKKKLITTQ